MGKFLGFLSVIVMSSVCGLLNCGTPSLQSKGTRVTVLREIETPGVDPEANMTMCEIITYHGFKCEDHIHKVVTSDGFLLTMFRIPCRLNATSCEPGYPVLIQHGLIGASSDFILNPATGNNLPFALVDQGYDVWLSNSRGNTYSRAHQTLTPDQDQFWAWSWDQMAHIDLPTCIDFVLSNTGYKTLYYVGHSQGTLIAFAHLSTTYTRKISHMVALAPVFQVAHIRSPMKLAAPLTKELEWAFKTLDVQEWLPNRKSMDKFNLWFCNEENPVHLLCEDGLFLITGFDSAQLNVSRLPVYEAHTPSGSSTQTVYHYAQMYNNRNVTRYDYGSPSENQKHYHQATPPLYEIYKINSTTISLFWGEDDWLADTQDVQFIRWSLSKQVVTDDVYIPKWDHIDFIWAMDIRKIVIDPVITIFKRQDETRLRIL